tara:strand:+ start:338 stop:556 length:219 start_codon:yes stop_codon:yes gene_type:complete
MVHKTKVSLRGLKSQFVTVGYGMRELKSKITNSQGSYVGSFITSGVGLEEHKRRLKAFAKDKVRSIKGEHEK